ncbi:unnamed protein product [Paramecium pentaurelia]|uniref:Transmembrane protein n=1 Tax=Paramecium pentaurelia TaxID=43138 RepID=A0A8S1XUB3_9CILI|nr:unnamed protein product [Paramecium pentaurelia]
MIRILFLLMDVMVFVNINVNHPIFVQLAFMKDARIVPQDIYFHQIKFVFLFVEIQSKFQKKFVKMDQFCPTKVAKIANLNDNLHFYTVVHQVRDAQYVKQAIIKYIMYVILSVVISQKQRMKNAMMVIQFMMMGVINANLIAKPLVQSVQKEFVQIVLMVISQYNQNAIRFVEMEFKHTMNNVISLEKQIKMRDARIVYSKMMKIVKFSILVCVSFVKKVMKYLPIYNINVLNNQINLIELLIIVYFHLAILVQNATQMQTMIFLKSQLDKINLM